MVANHEDGRLNGLEKRQARAFAHATGLVMKLGEAVDRGVFDKKGRKGADDEVVPEIGLLAFTKYLRDQGCGSAAQFKKGDKSASKLSPTGLMRALALFGKDWRSYCTDILRRRMKNDPDLATFREEDYYFNSEDGVSVVARSMTDEVRSILRQSNANRNRRWKYAISPMNYFRELVSEGIDFKNWLDARHQAFGKSHFLHYEEKEELRAHLRYQSHVNYGYYSDTFKEPDWQIPRKRTPKSDGQINKRVAFEAACQRASEARRAELTRSICAVREGLRLLPTHEKGATV